MSSAARQLPDPGETVLTVLTNKDRLAKALRCSKPTLNALIDRYPDFPVVRRGSNGRDWQFDVREVQDFLRVKKEEEAAAAQAHDELLAQITFDFLAEPSAEAPATLNPSDRLKNARAVREERKLQQESGLLVLAPAVQSAAATFCTELAQFLDTMPQAIGRQYNLPDAVVQAMRTQINDKRRHLVTELKRKLTQPSEHGRPSTLL